MAIGNDPKIAVGGKTQRQRWDRESVTRAIQDRAAASQPLNAKAVEVEDSRLIAAGRRLFENWNNALAAAGVDPASVRPPSTRVPRGSWNQQSIIAQIRCYSANAVPLYAHHIRSLDNRLVSAARYYFGSWSQALEAAGEDPNRIRHTVPRDSDQIIGAIRGLHAAHASLRDFSVRRQDRALYAAAQKHFGSWRNALKASGVEASGLGPNSRWSREDMRQIVREYIALGYPLGRVFRRHSHLKAAILREWGSVEALQADLHGEPPSELDTLSNKLRMTLSICGISVADVATELGIPLTVLTAYESGSLPMPLRMAHRIAATFKVSLDTVVDPPDDS